MQRGENSYCSRQIKLTVHNAQNKEIPIYRVGVYMNVFLRGTDCLQKSLDGIVF